MACCGSRKAARVPVVGRCYTFYNDLIVPTGDRASVGTNFSTIEAAIEAMGRGDVVIVVDAEDRENEGDFICAADKITPGIVNFMITNGRGQLCMPILPEVSER